jgi:hypothetical protein
MAPQLGGGYEAQRHRPTPDREHVAKKRCTRRSSPLPGGPCTKSFAKAGEIERPSDVHGETAAKSPCADHRPPSSRFVRVCATRRGCKHCCTPSPRKPVTASLALQLRSGDRSQRKQRSPNQSRSVFPAFRCRPAARMTRVSGPRHRVGSVPCPFLSTFSQSKCRCSADLISSRLLCSSRVCTAMEFPGS